MTTIDDLETEPSDLESLSSERNKFIRYDDIRNAIIKDIKNCKEIVVTHQTSKNPPCVLDIGCGVDDPLTNEMKRCLGCRRFMKFAKVKESDLR